MVYGCHLYKYPPIANRISVSAGTAPSVFVPRLLASFSKDLGIFMVSGFIKVKNKTLAPSCWYEYNFGFQSSSSWYPSSVLSANNM